MNAAEGTRSLHGLRPDTIGFAAAMTLAIASMAPAYSLATTLGLIARGLGRDSTASPAVLLVGVMPILCIAVAFDRLNRIDNDCGTTFGWVTRALGPSMGWMAGWMNLCACALVMGSLAQVSGTYTFRLLGLEAIAQSRMAVALAGTVWIAVMTWSCARGLASAARLQYALVAMEIGALVAFAVAALALASGAHAPVDASRPAASWFLPGHADHLASLGSAVLAAVFLYWGWETTTSMSEESRLPTRTPGRAAFASLAILLLVYLAVATAAQSVHGAPYLIEHSDDVLAALSGSVLHSPWDQVVVLAVLVSAAGAAQTTLIPSARTMLSMAAAGALPAPMGRVHPRFLTPHTATWTFGIVSCAWFVVLSFVSTNVLADSGLSTALLVALGYALCGYACPLVYGRARIHSWRNVLVLAVLPLLGAVALTVVFAGSCVALAKPAAAGLVWGISVPLLVGAGCLAIGIAVAALRVLAGSGHASHPNTAA